MKGDAAERYLADEISAAPSQSWPSFVRGTVSGQHCYLELPFPR